MIRALDHVIVAVRDAAEAGRDYGRLLGLAPSWQGSHPGLGTANVLFRLGNTYVELLAPDGDGPTGALLRARLEAVGEGMIGLAFGTDDAGALHATLAARGLDPGPVEPGHGDDARTGARREWKRFMLPMDRTRGLVLFPIEHTDGDLPEARPTGDPRASVSLLDHAVVQTVDPGAAIALFGDGLGLRLALDREFPDWGVRLMFFRVGGITVEVAATLSGSAPGLPESAADRLYGMSYVVPDADLARERLATLGFDVSEVRTGRRPNTRVFTVRDGTRGVPTLMLERS